MKYENQRNPILPLSVHIPDSEAHVMPDGRLYVYGSFDNREDVYCSGEYHVVSTPDMKHWEIGDSPSMASEDVPWFYDPDAPKYPGIDWSHPTPFILKMLAEHAEDREAFEKEDDTTKPALLFAPDCIEKDGNYYLYFCMNDDSEGVAVSDSPKGRFRNPVQLPCGGIDPAVFIDDDGQAYLYWGQLFSHGVPLNGDMVSFDREKIQDDLVTEEEHFFHEGSSMRKIGDTYYYLYADMERGKPTALGYSTGKSPLGPFTYRGIIIDNDGCDPESWNNHGSIQCFGGQWYVFYHRCSRGTQRNRRLCVEKINILPDGSIPEVKMTSQGVGEPFSPGEKIMGYQACEVHGGCYIDVDDVYGEKLTQMDAGMEAVFRYVRSGNCWESIQVTASGKGRIQVLLDGRQAGEVEACSDSFTTVSARLEAGPGEYELCLRVAEGEGIEIAEIVLR